MKFSKIMLIVYFVLLFLPIYWMVNTSFKTNEEVLSGLTFVPNEPTLDNYQTILSTEEWRNSFLNSLIYASLNVIITLLVSVPAVYAFTRWEFAGSNHLFFWMLTNRMAPAAAFMVPFTELYYTLHLFDTHLGVAIAHCLFNIPLSIWILEGFMRGIPKEVDEMAWLDGYSFPKFFAKIFLPLIGPGLGVAAFFCFTFSWVELILAKALTVVDAKPVVAMLTVGIGAEGVKWGLLAAAGTLTILPGVVLVYFVRRYIASGFALGRV